MPIRIKGNQLGRFGITCGILLFLSSIFSPEFQPKSFIASICIIALGIILHRATNEKKNPFEPD